jgi:hypothetical protein
MNEGKRDRITFNGRIGVKIEVTLNLENRREKGRNSRSDRIANYLGRCSDRNVTDRRKS